MSGWAKPSSRPDNRLRPAKISAELLGHFSRRPLFPGGGTLTFHKTEALRPVRTERPDCPKTIGRLERGGILSSFQSYTAARAAGRTFFCSGKSHFQRKAGKRWRLAGSLPPRSPCCQYPFCKLRRSALFGRSASIMLFCAIRNARTCRTVSSGRRAGSPPPSRSPSRRPDRRSNARRPSARHRAA